MSYLHGPGEKLQGRDLPKVTRSSQSKPRPAETRSPSPCGQRVPRGHRGSTEEGGGRGVWGPGPRPCSGPRLPVPCERSPLSHSALVLVLERSLEGPKLKTLLTLSKAAPAPWPLLRPNPHGRGARAGLKVA